MLYVAYIRGWVVGLYTDKIGVFLHFLLLTGVRFSLPDRPDSPRLSNARGPRIFTYATLSINILRSNCILIKAHIVKLHMYLHSF